MGYQMLLACFQFRGLISWKLNAGDPTLFALSEADEWALLSPLLYPQLPLPRAVTHCDSIAPGKYFIMTPEIVLATKDDQVIEAYKQSGPVKSGDLPLNLAQIAGKLLLRLRHAGGQATIPNYQSLLFCTFIELSSPPIIASMALPKSQNTMVQDYWWRTAITAEHVRATAPPGANFIPPTHEVLFLDAVAAHREADFRRAILYAAMSAEVVFGSVIDKAYERVIAAPHDERFRVIERAPAEGTLVLKDPIYERLRRRSDFDVLINELALYVLRRSLLVENETLYQKAKCLCTTRNKLAHTGVVNEIESKAYPLDADGSLAALETASALFSWLGERADFPLPKRTFVRIAD